ncbi:MAG: hypothetical protein HLUCCA11_18465, partial [Phormidesmis priestleyi Ana]
YLSQGEFPTIAALGQTLDSLPGKAGGLPLFSYLYYYLYCFS